jgi:alpha-D-xyloside xylohydrolase
MLTDIFPRCALLALFTLALAAAARPADAAGPKVDEVAPGVWRLRFGQPEKNTPLRFRSAPARTEAIAALPAARMPLDLKQASFVRSARGCAVQLPLTKEEKLYGFGLSPEILDMTGRHVFTRPTDKPENTLNDSHAPAPFYVSTQGYGVYVDTARYATFYTGNVNPAAKAQATGGSNAGAATSTEELYRPRELAEKTMLIDVPSAHGVDVYVFAGPAMANAIQRYNLFAGGGVVPPLWGLGMFYRGLNSFTARESLDLAKTFRDQHIPCDVWGLEPGWQTHTYSCSFMWNDKTFPDPDAFIREMSGMGYELSVWEHAFTHPTSPIFEPLKPDSGDYLVWSGLVPDFATPQARRIFQGQQDKVLYSKGVRAVKLDECDNQPSDPHPWSFPEASVFPSGLDGEQMHSLIGVLYQQTMLEPLRKRNIRSWNLVRNSHALAAPLPFVLYSDTYDHRGYVRALANEGFSGLLWGPEVRDTSTIEDFYRRVETVIFSPLAQIDSWFLRMPPWTQINREKNNKGEVMPESEKVTADMRRLFQLRMSLIPYLYSAFNEYYRTGVPPIRALVMDWPQDPNTYAVDDQFMFGPSLLVAPLFAGEKSRTVYLPAGDWYDFWTHEKVAGGRKIEVSKPLDQIPVFVKGNTLLPLAAPVERFTLETRYDLTVHAFGDRPAPFVLYEDDGASLDFERGSQNQVTLTWNGTAGAEARAGGYTGAPRYRVVDWQAHP